MTSPATIGRGLGRSFALATVIGMVVFAVIQALVIYVSELGEECAPRVFQDPPIEIIRQCSIALAISAPFGVVLSVALGRRLTNPTTARLEIRAAGHCVALADHAAQPFTIATYSAPTPPAGGAAYGEHPAVVHDACGPSDVTVPGRAGALARNRSARST